LKGVAGKGQKRGVRPNRRRTEPVGRRAVKRAARAARIIIAAVLVPAAAYGAYRAYGFVTTTTALSVDEITVLGEKPVELTPRVILPVSGSALSSM